jgi:hypothetical protein
MVFKPKLTRPGNNKTVPIRIPLPYKDLIQDLIETFDSRFDNEKGTYILKRYINSLK